MVAFCCRNSVSMLGAFAELFSAAIPPWFARPAGGCLESMCAALLAFGVGEAGARERRPSEAETSSSGRGPGPSGEAGVQVSLVRGSSSEN